MLRSSWSINRRYTGSRISGTLLSIGGILTIRRKDPRSEEPEADNGRARPTAGWFKSSTTFEELVEQQGVRPFVFPEGKDDEDKFDVDEFLDAIFGEQKRP